MLQLATVEKGKKRNPRCLNVSFELASTYTGQRDSRAARELMTNAGAVAAVGQSVGLVANAPTAMARGHRAPWPLDGWVATAVRSCRQRGCRGHLCGTPPATTVSIVTHPVQPRTVSPRTPGMIHRLIYCYYETKITYEEEKRSSNSRFAAKREFPPYPKTVSFYMYPCRMVCKA